MKIAILISMLYQYYDDDDYYYYIACKPILLSDPARAVLHLARSDGEIIACEPHSEGEKRRPEMRLRFAG